jgi:UDP-glucose 4-epimerase
MKQVAITGGAGYIGGQTAIYFKEQGWEVTVVDRHNLPERLEPFVDRFLHDEFHNEDALKQYASVDSIIHCAGSSLVGPSIKNPSQYYENNFIATKRMLDHLCQYGYHPKVVFSSSAAVYGNPIAIPIAEEDPKLPISPYGISKHMVEQLLETYSEAYGLNYVGLRYFNAAGADPEGRHGQEKSATHIIARVMEAIKEQKQFTLNGVGLATEDGTCVRDYVHVADIAKAHFLAQQDHVVPGFYNLSTGTGASNLEILRKCCTVSNNKPSVVVEGPGRAGDPDTLVANNTKFYDVCQWKNEYHVDDIIEHAWAWYNRGV